MERIENLILKLKEQFEQGADSSQLLFTVQMLQSELTAMQKTSRTLGTSKVAVVMPGNSAIDKIYFEKYAPRPANEEVVASKPVAAETVVQKEVLAFDPIMDIPTLSQQVNHKEEVKKSEEKESLNDRLKQQNTELFNVLKDTPIKDLRKAIGINDRFLLINELFRGDEAMYERSIKTINSFNVFTEAEYWINRELKVKLGWLPDSEAAILFDQLIKRRFS